MALTGGPLATSEESSGVSPAAAVDDENAWNAICRVLHPKWDEWMEEAIDFHDGEISDNQRNIRLDAIRLIERDSAQAAHAEALGLISDALGYPGDSYVRERIESYLAKHGGGK